MEFSQQINHRKVLIILGVIAALGLLIFIGYQFYLSRNFRVVSTSPKTNNVAAVSPFLKINFNRQLSSKGLSVSSSYSVVKSYEVEGKTLLVNLASPMTAGYKYSVRINYIADTKGETLTAKNLTFTPKNIPWQKLSKDQQAALLQAQSKRPKLATATFKGMNDLVDLGVNSGQIAALQNYLLNFAPKATIFTVDKNSIVAVPHNRNSASTMDTINFNINIGSQAYKARLDYSYLSNSARLYLYDSTGAQVFDSSTLPVDRTEQNSEAN